MKQALFTTFATICIIVATLASGIVLCTYVPQITENLSRATATVDVSHFNRDQLVQIAEKTRAYVASQASKDDLYATVEEINKAAQTEFKDLVGSDFAAISDEYALDANSITHLGDVAHLLANIKIAFGICLFGAILFSILLIVFCGPSALGRTFKLTGAIMLIGMLAFAIWALIDFDGMFNWLHSLFFASGSWLFSAKSLLICMYPLAFWVGMAAICIGITVIVSVILLFVGKILK